VILLRVPVFSRRNGSRFYLEKTEKGRIGFALILLSSLLSGFIFSSKFIFTLRTSRYYKSALMVSSCSIGMRLGGTVTSHSLLSQNSKSLMSSLTLGLTRASGLRCWLNLIEASMSRSYLPKSPSTFRSTVCSFILSMSLS
jgi:hypothetical protein